MKKLTLSLFFFVLLFVSQNSVFSQESFTHPDAKVTVVVQGGWFYEINGTSLTMYPQSKEMSVGFNIIDAADMESAVQKAKQEIMSNFPNANLTGPTQHDVNGITVFEISGDSPDRMEFSYSLLITPSAKVMEVGYASQKDAVNKFKSDVTTIITGIKPAN